MEEDTIEVDEPQSSKVVDVIPVHLVDDESFQTYKNIGNTSQNSRSKYYKQTYRPAWEQMPDFAGWLRGVEKQPTRAFCIYCQKTLHAHRLSLLKHTCTMRHQKAAQLHQVRNKMKGKSHLRISSFKGDTVSQSDDVEQEEDEIIEFSESALIADNEEENMNEVDPDHIEEEEDEDAEVHLETINISEKFSSEAYIKEEPLPPISTQVTDGVRGVPISGLQVSLYKLIDGRWTYINEGFTNHSGRCSKFLEGLEFTPGRYKLHYDVDRYFEAKKQESIFPFIEIVFDYHGMSNNYHIPLILSPNSYTVYRGC